MIESRAVAMALADFADDDGWTTLPTLTRELDLVGLGAVALERWLARAGVHVERRERHGSAEWRLSDAGYWALIAGAPIAITG